MERGQSPRWGWPCRDSAWPPLGAEAEGERRGRDLAKDQGIVALASRKWAGPALGGLAAFMAVCPYQMRGCLTRASLTAALISQT